MTTFLPAPVRITAQTPRSQQKELWSRYNKTGPGSPIENDVVQQYLPLVKTVVGRIAMTLPAHVSADDLYSAGLVGLLNAIRRYDASNGTSFETYARVRIRGSIVDELRRLDWIPRSVHEKAKQVEKAMREIEQLKGESATEEELADAMDMSLNEFQKLWEKIRPATFVCLDSVRGGDEEGPNRYETLADERSHNPDERTARKELSEIIAKRIAKLPEMQRKVLALYYFEDLRLREIAEVFGVTESRICQVHAQAISAIKSYLKQENAL